jgi:hypothetical protein
MVLVLLNYTYLRCHYLDRIYFVWGSSYCTLNRLLFCMRIRSLLCVCERERERLYMYMCAANQALNYCAFCTSASHYVLHVCYFRPGRF